IAGAHRLSPYLIQASDLKSGGLLYSPFWRDLQEQYQMSSINRKTRRETIEIKREREIL
ncbi:unnamed protein product, partial [Larinioides sclopetarius]